ncbi:MAG: hypothetical protein Q8R79_07715 [Legionellaceae bacterium]|nr:hypothetical protein [Legionellaceae bacterium]
MSNLKDHERYAVLEFASAHHNANRLIQTLCKISTFYLQEQKKSLTEVPLNVLCENSTLSIYKSLFHLNKNLDEKSTKLIFNLFSMKWIVAIKNEDQLSYLMDYLKYSSRKNPDFFITEFLPRLRNTVAAALLEKSYNDYIDAEQGFSNQFMFQFILISMIPVIISKAPIDLQYIKSIEELRPKLYQRHIKNPQSREFMLFLRHLQNFIDKAIPSSLNADFSHLLAEQHGPVTSPPNALSTEYSPQFFPAASAAPQKIVYECRIGISINSETCSDNGLRLMIIIHEKISNRTLVLALVPDEALPWENTPSLCGGIPAVLLERLTTTINDFKQRKTLEVSISYFEDSSLNDINLVFHSLERLRQLGLQQIEHAIEQASPPAWPLS